MTLSFPRSSSSWICLLFLVIAFVVFGQTLTHDFVMWDDTYLIYSNPDIKGFSLRNLINAFSTFDPELYIPLTLLSYQLDYTIAGLNPTIYHLTNLILHTLNALLVSYLLQRLTQRKTLSIIGGLLFLVHPLSVEAAAWASARKDVLSTFFFLASLLSFLYYRQTAKQLSYYGSLIAFLLGLLSKVMVVTLPVVLLLLDWREGRKIEKRSIIEKTPFFALSIVFGVVALFGKQEVVTETTLTEKLLMAGKSTVFYLEKFFVPLKLSALYPWNGPIELSSPTFFVPLIALCLLAALIVLSLKATRDIFFAFAFFLITLIPTFTNFAKGGELYVASDRYAYVPMIGLIFFLLIAWTRFIEPGIHESFGRRNAVSVSAAIATVMLFTASVLSFRQTQTWRDSFTFLEYTVAHYPDAIAAQINLGVAHRRNGDLEKSKEILEGILGKRRHPRAMTALAAVYLEQGNTAKAIELCTEAEQIDPRDPEPAYGLALAYEKEGRSDEAKKAYERTIVLQPKHAAAHNNLAALYWRERQTDEAIRLYEKAIELDPTFPDAPYNLGLLYSELERYESAAAMLEKATDLRPNDIEGLTKLVSLYAELNDREQTMRTLEKILAIDPDHAFAKKMREALGE